MNGFWRGRSSRWTPCSGTGAQWPYVKNLVPHHYLYSYGRMQEVWLDK